MPKMLPLCCVRLRTTGAPHPRSWSGMSRARLHLPYCNAHVPSVPVAGEKAGGLDGNEDRNGRVPTATLMLRGSVTNEEIVQQPVDFRSDLFPSPILSENLMGLLHQLFRRDVRLKHHRCLAGAGDYTTLLKISPEHQDALATVVGGRTQHSAHYECTVFLVPEPENLDVPGSVAVHIAGYKVGYLDQTQGEHYRRFLASSGRSGLALCNALVTGGWVREEGEGYFSVRLDIAWPLRFEEELPLEIAA